MKYLKGWPERIAVGTDPEPMVSHKSKWFVPGTRNRSYPQELHPPNGPPSVTVPPYHRSTSRSNPTRHFEAPSLLSRRIAINHLSILPAEMAQEPRRWEPGSSPPSRLQLFLAHEQRQFSRLT